MTSRVFLGIGGGRLGHFEDILYPRGTAAEDYLKHYAREFGVIELSDGDVRAAGRERLQRLLASTPRGFRFAVTRHLELEHNWDRDVGELRELVQPLAEPGRLGALVVELPSWFHYAAPSRRRLAELCAHLEGLPLAIAFHRRDWYRKPVVEGLRARGVALVSEQTDVPEASAMPSHAQVTGRFAYFRFMGRHARYHLRRVNQYFEECRYTPEELAPWAERIEAISRWAEVFALFRHQDDGSAVYSARLLRRLLG